MNIKIMSVILAILSGASLARSQGTLSWQFDSTAFVVEPTDQILLTGTVVNSSDTPYLIQPGGEVASFTGDLQYYYQVSWLLDFLGKTVPADGSLQFDFCTLIPIGGYVQPGIYQADPISNPADINFGGGLLPSQNFFQITVVPEPSTVCLGGVGLACIFMLRLGKRRILDETTKWPNQSSEPTAVGACRSAIAVHVASRRWLSFFR